MTNMKKDLIFSLVCGELAAWFLIFIIKNPYIEEFKGAAAIGELAWFLPLFLPLFFAFGILAAKIFSKIIPLLFQIAKFVEIGVLNTFIDAGILNLLVWFTGITSGGFLAPLNSISFLAAAVNSFYWNKLWTFSAVALGGSGQSKTSGKFLQFLLISAIGWGINTAIVVLGATFLNPIFSVSSGAWLNIMKISATFVAMVWNFIGYKFIVFKSK